MTFLRGGLRSLLPFLVSVPILLLVQWRLNQAGMDLVTLIAINSAIAVILSVSLNVVNGFTGQFSLGHAGFMAVGAYTAAKITQSFGVEPLFGLPPLLTEQLIFALALAAGMLTSALAGLIVGMPSLRLRGDYLAIVTLGFGMIIISVVENMPSLGGAIGLSGLPAYTTLTWAGVSAVATITMARRIAVSTQGRALFAIREDEVAAEAMGVDTTGYKVRAFVISAAYAGLAGGLIVHQLQLATPASFSFIRSFEVVVMVVLGGLGSITGAVVSAAFLTVILEVLRSLLGEFDKYRMVVYALMLIVLMLLRPQGLFGTHELWDLPLFRKLPWKKMGVDTAGEGASPVEARDDVEPEEGP
jgi:branched-chain amino acid transport system permease protein